MLKCQYNLRVQEIHLQLQMHRLHNLSPVLLVDWKPAIKRLKRQETVSIAKPLQNRQHVQTPYLAKFGMRQWASGLCSQFNVIWIMDRCIVAHAGQKTKCSNFDQIFTFWGLLCSSPSTDPGQIWPETVDPWSTFTGQIPFELVYCVTFHGKNRNLRQLLTFRENGPVHIPFTDDGQIWYAIAYSWSTLTRQISFWSVYNSVAFWRRRTRFLDFGILWWRKLAAIWES